jgi:hypothetical protein
MRTAIHEAGHGLAAIQYQVRDYRVSDTCDAGECRYRGASLHKNSEIWVALAGPAAERRFFGSRNQALVVFSGTRDLAIVGDMALDEYTRWDERLTKWADRYADNIEALAGELA